MPHDVHNGVDDEIDRGLNIVDSLWLLSTAPAPGLRRRADSSGAQAGTTTLLGSGAWAGNPCYRIRSGSLTGTGSEGLWTPFRERRML